MRVCASVRVCGMQIVIVVGILTWIKNQNPHKLQMLNPQIIDKV